MSVGAAGQNKQTEQNECVFHGEDLLSFGKDMHCAKIQMLRRTGFEGRRGQLVQAGCQRRAFPTNHRD